MISIRIYKDIPQGKLVVNFRILLGGVYKRSNSIILGYLPFTQTI